MIDTDTKALITLAEELLHRCFEAEKANLEQGIMCRGSLTFRQLAAEKASFTRRLNTIKKELRGWKRNG